MPDTTEFAYSDLFRLNTPPMRVVEIINACVVLLGMPLSPAARQEISTQMYEIFKIHKTKSSWVLKWMEEQKIQRLTITDYSFDDSGITPMIYFKTTKAPEPFYGMPFVWESKSPLDSGVHQRKE